MLSHAGDVCLLGVFFVSSFVVASRRLDVVVRGGRRTALAGDLRRPAAVASLRQLLGCLVVLRRRLKSREHVKNPQLCVSCNYVDSAWRRVPLHTIYLSQVRHRPPTLSVIRGHDGVDEPEPFERAREERRQIQRPRRRQVAVVH